MPTATSAIRLCPVLAIYLFFAGCTSVETYPETIASPAEAWLTIRAALLTEDAELLYRCLAPEFRERKGVRGLADLKLAWQSEGGEIKALAALAADAAVGEPRLLGGGKGAREVLLPVTARGRTVDLVFIEVPTFTVRIDSESYDYRRDGESNIRIQDDRLQFDHPLDPALALDSAAEVEEFRIHVRWLLKEAMLP